MLQLNWKLHLLHCYRICVCYEGESHRTRYRQETVSTYATIHDWSGVVAFLSFVSYSSVPGLLCLRFTSRPLFSQRKKRITQKPNQHFQRRSFKITPRTKTTILLLAPQNFTFTWKRIGQTKTTYIIYTGDYQTIG